MKNILFKRFSILDLLFAVLAYIAVVLLPFLKHTDSAPIMSDGTFDN